MTKESAIVHALGLADGIRLLHDAGVVEEVCCDWSIVTFTLERPLRKDLAAAIDKLGFWKITDTEWGFSLGGG